MLYGQFDDTTGVSYWAVDRDSVRKSLDELGVPYWREEDEQENGAAKEN